MLVFRKILRTYLMDGPLWNFRPGFRNHHSSVIDGFVLFSMLIVCKGVLLITRALVRVSLFMLGFLRSHFWSYFIPATHY